MFAKKGGTDQKRNRGDDVVRYDICSDIDRFTLS